MKRTWLSVCVTTALVFLLASSSWGFPGDGDAFFDDLIGGSVAPAEDSVAAEGSDADEIIIEPEQHLTLRGRPRRSARGFVVTDEASGETFELVGFAESDVVAADSFEGFVDIAFGDDDVPRLRLIADRLRRPSKRISFSSIRDFLRRLSPIQPAHASENPYARIVFPHQVRDEAYTFLRLWQTYLHASQRSLAAEYEKHRDVTSLSTSTLDTINRRVHDNNKAAFDAAIAACDAYIDALVAARIWDGVDNKTTYIHIDKRTFLLRVVCRERGVTLLAVPCAYGRNPDGGEKVRNGDNRTPSTGASLASVATTPFYVGRRVPYTAAPGMTTRVMGVSSSRKSDEYWVRHGMNIAIHGTAAPWSMGLRASAGCIRVRDEHVIHVYDLTSAGYYDASSEPITPIVIRSLD